MEGRGNLDSSGASKLFVVSTRTARSLSQFVAFKTLGTVALFSLLSRLSKSIVLNKLSKSKKKCLNKSHWTS